jgi:exonuclease III
MFARQKLDVLALSETKMKGKGESMFGEVKGRISGVGGGRGREGVALLLSERVLEKVVEWREVSSRILWVKMKWEGESWIFVSAYGPGSERSDQEREEFWKELSECIDGFGINSQVVVLGDLNARVGDEEVEGVVGKYGVPGRNESGRELVDMCMERRLVIGNTVFKKRRVKKYTWARVSHGRIVE